MKVFSGFDGISCARVALERAGISVERYFASEIDEYAMKVSRKNWSDIMQVGSIVGLGYDAGQFLRDGNTLGVDYMEDIDLFIGGSPCQDLSAAKGKGREGLKGARSGLFFEYLRLLKEVNPKYFILENVASMSKEARDEITAHMGVEPIMINATLVSAQDRKRYFWTNIPGVTLPEDKGIHLRDVVDLKAERKWHIPKNVRHTRTGIAWDTSGKGYHSQQDRAYFLDGKHPTVPTARTITKVKFYDAQADRVGVLNWPEVEALQSLRGGYTDIGENNRVEKRGGVIGNGFNVDVIAHILSFIPHE